MTPPKGQRLIQSGAKVNLHLHSCGASHQLLHWWTVSEPRYSPAGLVKLGLSWVMRKLQSKGFEFSEASTWAQCLLPSADPSWTEILLLRAAALCKPPSRSFFISFSFLLSADWAYKWGAFRLSCKITGAYLENYNFAFPLISCYSITRSYQEPPSYSWGCERYFACFSSSSIDHRPAWGWEKQFFCRILICFWLESMERFECCIVLNNFFSRVLFLLII